MQSTVREFLSIFSPEEAVVHDVRATLAVLCADVEVCDLVRSLTADFRTGTLTDYMARANDIQSHAERLGVHPFAGNLLLILHLAMLTRDKYREAGLSGGLWEHTMRDILYKITECRLVHGVTGIFVPEWYEWFFSLRRFAFGRLQFECIEGRGDVSVRDTVVRAEERRINIHIPRTGTPMSPEAVDDALRAAADFFRARMGLERVIFEIRSWLLFPAHEDMLREGSNILHFAHRFTLADHGEYKNYDHVWRLFDTSYTGDPDALPADSSLRRAYIQRMKEGLPLGWGYGVLVYD